MPKTHSMFVSHTLYLFKFRERLPLILIRFQRMPRAYASVLAIYFIRRNALAKRYSVTGPLHVTNNIF